MGRLGAEIILLNCCNRLQINRTFFQGSRCAGGHYTTITGQSGQASSAAPLCPRQNPQQSLLSRCCFSAFSVSAFPCSSCGPWSRGPVVSLSHLSFSAWPSG